MANRFILKNNFSTTLAAGITAVQTAVTVTSATGIATPGTGQTLRLTLEDPADPSVNEIVGVTAVSGNNLTIVRAQEGTTGAIWASGTKVELRLTAGVTDGILQGLDSTGDAINALSLDIQTGRASSSQTASGFKAVTIGHNAVATDNESVALGSDVSADGFQAVAVGKSADAAGYGAVAAGLNASAPGDFSVTLLPRGNAPNRPGDITGRQQDSTVGILANKRLAFDYAAHYAGYDYIHRNSTDHIYQDDYSTPAATAVRETTLISPPLQFGDEGWPGATTSVQHGHVIRVGSFCYMAYCWVGAYPNGGYYGAGTTGATEPTWPTTHGDWVAVTDGDIDWVCLSPTFEFAMPDFARFTPTSVGVIARKSTPGGSVVYPQITAGPVGDTTAWLAATTQSKLTGDMSNHFTDPASTAGAKNFVAAISTAGSDLDCVGHLVIRGYVIESDVT